MSYLIFVWSPAGYELREQDGEPPNVGDGSPRRSRSFDLRIGAVGEHEPGGAAGLPRDRLREVVLVPRGRAGEEFLAALVEHARTAAVELRERDVVVLPDPRRGSGQRPAVELVRVTRNSCAPRACVLESIALAPRIRADDQATFVREPYGIATGG